MVCYVRNDNEGAYENDGNNMRLWITIRVKLSFYWVLDFQKFRTYSLAFFECFFNAQFLNENLLERHCRHSSVKLDTPKLYYCLSTWIFNVLYMPSWPEFLLFRRKRVMLRNLGPWRRGESTNIDISSGSMDTSPTVLEEKRINKLLICKFTLQLHLSCIARVTEYHD